MQGPQLVHHALVVIPTYEERGSLAQVVRAALAADDRVHVLVVDDASPDGTGKLAEELAADEPRVSVHHRAAKAGLGSAYRYGLARGVAERFDAVGEMDGDGSHDPRDLASLLAVLDAGADVALGSRYVPGGRVEGWPVHRRWLSRVANAYARGLAGCPVRDVTSGCRLYRSRALRRVPLAALRSDGYAFQVEMVLHCWQAGLDVREVPITFTQRHIGASKLGPAVVAEALWRTTLWGLAVRVGRWRRRAYGR